MRADRLLALLLHLQTTRHITARELAERLEVSERTIYRDLDALSAAGVPVYAERGPGGGVALAEQYRTTLNGLNDKEVRTLFMAGAPGPLADLGLDKSMEAAMLKLLAALPSAHREAADRARQRIHLDAAGWNFNGESVPHLPLIQSAVWQERRLGLTYQRDGLDGPEKLVEPYGLVAKANVWYLVGRSVEYEAVRVYRVSRIHAVRLCDDYFDYPAGFDLAAFWQGWCADFKAGLRNYPVRIRLSPQGQHLLYHVFGEAARTQLETASPPDADGWVDLTMNFDSLETARGRLLGLDSAAEILEPLELRESIIKLAQELSTFYASRAPLAELVISG